MKFNFFNFKKDLLLSIISVAIFMLIWEFVSINKLINPIFIGQPSQIINELFVLFSNNDFFNAFTNSLNALIKGYLLALFIGVGIGYLLGLSKNFYYIARPYVFAINSIPLLAFIPLIILWVGVGSEAKITVIVLMAIIPFIMNSYEGIRSVDQKLIEMANSFQISKSKQIKDIYFWQSLPFVLSASRIALGRAFIGLIVAEFYGFEKGIGYYISFYGMTYKPNKLMAILLIILLLNILITTIIR